MAQPPPSKLTVRGLLTFPYRLCHPPPAVGKVRSCGVTPFLDIRLDDVLARRHLPPIGLKDLEEYLLYVERTPENLYFILWLKEYTSRYQAWVQREKMSLVSKKEKMASKVQRKNFPLPPTPDSGLAMFYLRAKQTFLTPNGEYELNIPSDVLSPFHSSPRAHTSRKHPQDHAKSSLWHSQSVHPDPAVFAEVAIEARCMLQESLKRFIRAASTNVGSQRAICGIIGGSFFTLVGGMLPLVMTTGRWNMGPHGFLIRLVAFPGLWFGLTVLISSLQGICLMIYFFGDLRQLRKFELARPTISRPIPIPISSPIPHGSTPSRVRNLFVPTRRPPPLPTKPAATSSMPSSLDSPISFVTPTGPGPRPQFSNASLARSSYESCESDAPSGYIEIDVSPAFFDDVPAPEGPATASCLYRPEYHLSPPTLTYLEPVHTRPEPPHPGRSAVRTPAAGSPAVADPQPQPLRRSRSTTRSQREFGPTAGFIPNTYSNSTPSLGETRSLRSQQSACYFDFDALPSKVSPRQDGPSTGDGPSSRAGAGYTSFSSVVMEPSSPHASPLASTSSPTLGGVGHFFGRAQYKCNQRASGGTTAAATSPTWDKSSFSDESTTAPPRRRWFSFATLIPSFTAGVPAFAAPLTQVQSPAVKRAQWEVVIRAGFMAALAAGTVTGIIVGVVP